MAVADTRVFISHSTKNAAFVDRLVGGSGTITSRRGMPRATCPAATVVVVSPEALASAWVKQETDHAMADPRYYNKVIPILAEPCEWKTLHEHLGR